MEDRQKRLQEEQIENFIFIILLVLTFIWYGSMFISMKIFAEKISQGKYLFDLTTGEIFFVLLSIFIVLLFLICIWQIKLLRIYFSKHSILNISQGLNGKEYLEIYFFDEFGKKLRGKDYCFSGGCYYYWFQLVNFTRKILRR